MPMSCPSLLLVHSTAIFAENWTLFIVAVNRFIAVELPHRYRESLRKSVLSCQLLLPWLIALSVVVPARLGIGGEAWISPNTGVCYQKSNGSVYLLVEFAVGLYTPIAATGAVYFVLFFRLAVRRNRIAGHVAPRSQNGTRLLRPRVTSTASSGGRQNAVISARLKLGTRTKQIATARMLLCSFVWYCFCFIPGPSITVSMPQLYQASSASLQLWLTKTFLVCGYAGSPVILDLEPQ